MNQDVMHIVYASDGNYAPFMGVSLVSLLAHNSPVQVHILDAGISRADREKTEKVCRKYGAPAPHWLPANDISKELKMAVAADRGSLAQFARIFISRHLDPAIERVLYLDCDTLVTGSVRDLWETDLKRKTAAVLLDAFSRYYRRNIDLQPTDIMFNSGVMLVDMKRWREQEVEERALSFIRRRRGFIEKGDQGALNAVLSHDCLCFDPKFNAVTIFFDFSYQEMLRYRRPPEYYPEEQVQNAANHPVIIHYTVSFLSKRPWMKGCEHPWKDEWLKYKEISPWAGMPLTEEKRSWRVNAMRKLPRGLMLRVAGIMQAYGRPWLHYMRTKKLLKQEQDKQEQDKQEQDKQEQGKQEQDKQEQEKREQEKRDLEKQEQEKQA